MSEDLQCVTIETYSPSWMERCRRWTEQKIKREIGRSRNSQTNKEALILNDASNLCCCKPKQLYKIMPKPTANRYSNMSMNLYISIVSHIIIQAKCSIQ